MRTSSSHDVPTTTNRTPIVFSPRVTNRCSPSADSSSMVSANGSLKTPSPSARETPCFLRFAASFLGSKVAVTRLVYAHRAYTTTLFHNYYCGLVCAESQRSRLNGRDQ